MSDDPLAARKAELLSAIRAFGDQFASRRQIAERLGKKKLNSADVLVLEVLIHEDQIESRKTEMTGLIGFSIEYRAK